MNELFKGVLIDQSVFEPEKVLAKAKVISSRETSLEGENFRGKVLFHNIEVSTDKLWQVLSLMAETIKSPGWYFHLINEERLYIVLPKVILIAGNDEAELKNIVEYAKNYGIHPDQLNLKQLFDNPFA